MYISQPIPFLKLSSILPSHFFPTNTDLTLDLQLNNIHGLIILEVNLTVPERTNYWCREKTQFFLNCSPGQRVLVRQQSLLPSLTQMLYCTPLLLSLFPPTHYFLKDQIEGALPKHSL